MEIQKGKYRIENRNLKFDVVENLNFHNNGGCYFLRGDNGLGKTSFLEKIIIPALKANKLSYLYIGQDIRTQLYTLRALLSTKGIKVADSDEIRNAPTVAADYRPPSRHRLVGDKEQARYDQREPAHQEYYEPQLAVGGVFAS